MPILYFWVQTKGRDVGHSPWPDVSNVGTVVPVVIPSVRNLWGQRIVPQLLVKTHTNRSSPT